MIAVLPECAALAGADVSLAGEPAYEHIYIIEAACSRIAEIWQLAFGELAYGKLSKISPVERYICAPTLLAHVHTCALPQLHMEKRISLPLALSASDILLYESWLCIEG